MATKIMLALPAKIEDAAHCARSCPQGAAYPDGTMRCNLSGKWVDVADRAPRRTRQCRAAEKRAKGGVK